MLQEPVNLGHRKVQKNRNSISMILPKKWTKFNGVELGNEVVCTMEKDGTLSVRKSGGRRT
jgi:antitoxin component of MazEF toxin-antitoxin module